jgi:hypothetical protein
MHGVTFSARTGAVVKRSGFRTGEKRLGRWLLWVELAVVTAYALFRFYDWAIACHIPMKPDPGPDRLVRSIVLRRGPFTFFDFPSRRIETRAVIIFGSGDAGWGGWEDAVSRAMAANGYEVIGVDFVPYAKTDYDLDTLQADYTQLAQLARGTFVDHAPPLILGGWSMGAEQAVPAAAGPHPPPGLAGLLLLSPGQRGRYGLRTSDKLDIPPTGPGTFALQDFSKSLGNLRVLQWHAGLDPIDSTTWLRSLPAPHREMDFPGVWHDFNGPSDVFVQEMVRSLDWILAPPH